MPPITKYACGLAALSWNLHKVGVPKLQEALLNDIGPHFPEWYKPIGLYVLELDDLIRALRYVGIHAEKWIVSNSVQELMQFTKPNKQHFLMGFARFLRPSSHVIAIGDWNEDELTWMDAGYPNAATKTTKWTDLVQAHDARFLFLFHSGIQAMPEGPNAE
jgi:hypothetical protein